MESEPQVTTSCLLLCLACSNQAESFNSWVHFHLFKMKNAQGYELLCVQLYLIIQLLDSEIGFDFRPDSREGNINFQAAPSGDLCTSLIQSHLSHIDPPQKHPRAPVSLSHAHPAHTTLLQVLTYLSGATIHKEVLQP